MTGSAPGTDLILTADRQFFDALLAADRAKLDELLAPEFLIVDVATGGVTYREDFMDFVTAASVRFKRIESFPNEAVLRRFDDTAIIVGRTIIEFTMPDNTQVKAGSRYTHVFVASEYGGSYLLKVLPSANHGERVSVSHKRIIVKW
jgi:hypothetical protein